MLISAFALLTAVQTGGPTVHSVAEWRADLAHVVNQVQTKHPLPYMYGVSEEEFSVAVKQLSKEIPTMSDGRILLEIFKVYALLDDSHTEPYWNTIPENVIDMRIVPVRLYHFSDGLFITQAQPSQKSLLGAKVIEIDGRPINEVLEKAMEYMSGDNPIRRRTVAIEIVLTRPGVLHALDLCHNSNELTYTLQLANGEEKEVPLKVLNGPSFTPGLHNEASLNGQVGEWSSRKWLHVNDQSKLPLWLQDRGRRYWFEYLEREQVLYMRFARVIDDPAEPFDDFTDRMFAFIDKNDVEVLVIDARRNKGGYGNFGVKLANRLAKHELGKKGRLFMIMGRGSKSATPYFAWRLELAASPTFIGEPSGGRPTPFGNTFLITFPNSTVQVRMASAVFNLTGTPDPRKTITPEYKAELSFGTFQKNWDSVLAQVMPPIPHAN